MVVVYLHVTLHRMGTSLPDLQSLIHQSSFRKFLVPILSNSLYTYF